jgi:hypothetical protein
LLTATGDVDAPFPSFQSCPDERNYSSQLLGAGCVKQAYVVGATEFFDGLVLNIVHNIGLKRQKKLHRRITARL